MAAPTLLTPRMELRGHGPDDLAACLKLWSDPEVTRYTVGQPLTRQDVWTRLLRHPGHWALLGFGYWLAFDRTTGQLLGEVGLANFKRDSMAAHPAFADVPEAGWVFFPAVHGQGYASEAVQAVLDWRDKHLAGKQTFCLIDPANAPSLRLAAKFGFEAAGEVGSGEKRTLVLVRG